MTQSETITATFQEIRFDQTYISDLNTRTIVDKDSIAGLAENIRQLGLIHPLAGLADADGRIGIVAGGRRHRALALLQDEARFQTVTVHVAPDEATARIWASTENHQREQPHPADEIQEYSAMFGQSVSVPTIAIAFGVTEAHVQRRLRLSGLPKPVLAALRADEISLTAAAAFTVSEDKKRTLEVLERVRTEGSTDQQIRRMLKQDSVRSSDRRAIFVGQEAYQAAGGRMTTDLFAQELYFDDVALLDGLFGEKLTEVALNFKDEGWKWVEALEESYVGYHIIAERKFERLYPERGALSDDEAVQYNDLVANADSLNANDADQLEALQQRLDGVYSNTQKAVSGGIVSVDHMGQVQMLAGLVAKADRDEAAAAGVLTLPETIADSRSKSPISQKLQADLDRVVIGAHQHAALRDPDLVLTLLAFELSGKAGYCGNVFGLRMDDVPNTPSTGTDGYILDPRLTRPAKEPKDPWNVDLARSFRAFRGKGMDHIHAELHRHLAALLTPPEGLLDVLNRAVAPDVREVWTPSATNFFSRVSASYLTKVWQDLLGLDDTHPTVTTFKKLKKADKAQKLEALFNDPDQRAARSLTDEQEARIAAWVPVAME